MKSCRRTAGELIVTHNTTSRSYPGRSKSWNTHRMQSYYYGRRIGMMEMICMAWQRWCNATYPFKRSRNPGQTIIRFELFYYPAI